MDVAAYDWTPVARVALAGLALAAGPLAWIWLRHRGAAPGARLRALTLLTAFLTFDLVLFGAFTRLTDSGLGCPDWPGCYGHASPLGAAAPIDAAQTAQPTGPVTHRKAWIEMVHRYLATGVGVLIVVLAAAAWRARLRRESGAPSPGWATATLVWVCVQGAFGALTVTMKLYPAVVTAHLLGGLTLLALLVAQAQRPGEGRPPFAVSPRLQAGLWALAALAVTQIALGGWVSTNYAVLACSDVPTCQGRWWPEMDFGHAFTLRRELGRGADGGWLPFAALTAIHMTHRLMAVALLTAMVLAAWRLAVAGRRGGAPALGRWGLALAGVGVWQLASGLSNVVLGWPIVAAVAHTAGAAVLVTVLTVLLVRTRATSPRRLAAAVRDRRVAAAGAAPIGADRGRGVLGTAP